MPKTLPVQSARDAQANQTDQDNFNDARSSGSSPEKFFGLTSAQVKQVEAGTHYVDWSS